LKSIAEIFYCGLAYTNDLTIADEMVYKNICNTCRTISEANKMKNITMDVFLVEILIKNVEDLKKCTDLTSWTNAVVHWMKEYRANNA
jgi:hypothetical protein